MPASFSQRATGDGLFATVKVARLGAGAILVPNTCPMASGTSLNVLIEIGCSDVDTMDEDVLPLDNSSFQILIVFEPLLVDKYATLTARGNTRINGPDMVNVAVPLGFHHPRGVVLPLAVDRLYRPHPEQRFYRPHPEQKGGGKSRERRPSNHKKTFSNP